MQDDLITTPGICLANTSYLRDFFKTNNVPVYLETGVKEIKDGAVVIADKEGNEKIIKCITGEVKAHTYNRYPPETGEIASFEIDSGLVQTGIAYPNSYNALHGTPFSEDNIDSSIIEFRGQELDFNPSDYELKEIVIIEE